MEMGQDIVDTEVRGAKPKKPLVKSKTRGAHLERLPVFKEDAAKTEAALKAVLRDRTASFIKACLLLYKIRLLDYHKLKTERFREYVENFGITLTNALKMFKIAAIYIAMCEQTGLDTIPFERVTGRRLMVDWLPCVQYNKETKKVENLNDVLELLEQAKVLTNYDFGVVKDQYLQKIKRPEVKPAMVEGPVMDENRNIVGNYKTKKATGKTHYFDIAIQDQYITNSEGNELKVRLGLKGE